MLHPHCALFNTAEDDSLQAASHPVERGRELAAGGFDIRQQPENTWQYALCDPAAALCGSASWGVQVSLLLCSPMTSRPRSACGRAVLPIQVN